MMEFGNIVKNEWIKLIRRRRFLVVLLLGIVLVSIYAYAQHLQANHIKHDADPAVQKQEITDRIERLESRLNTDAGLTAADKANIADRIKSLNQSVDQLNQPQPDLTVFDAATTQKTIDDLNKQIQAMSPDKEVEIGELQLEVQLQQYTLDHHIPMVVNHDPPITAWSAIRDLLDIGSQLFIPLLCVLLAADMVSGEQSGGTIKLLLTRPASRGKILFAKYITTVTASVSVIAIILAVLTGLLLLVFGPGGAHAPIAVDVKYHSVTEMIHGSMTHTVAADPSTLSIVTASHFSLNAILLTLVATVAMCTLGFFCSILVRSAAVSTGVAIATIIIGTIVVHIISGAKWMQYFITANFGLPSSWTGDLSQQFGFPVTLTSSIVILLVWTVVMYGAGHTIFKRRDILG
ncbi:ABC transporter permease subunit [Cohnella yongneupensis]|uniref:ABC transporter permease subunit n=1 Tax=Cohnella yongneupensis TaxID=425006 RepID=A0ABW0QZ36_9BACL